VLHELWLDENDDSQTFCDAGPRGDGARNLLSKNARLIWTVEAKSHFDAMTKYYKYMGWGEYTSDFPELDKKTYKELGWK
jgi:hypothetical protein